jgi:hypothetical protein
VPEIQTDSRITEHHAVEEAHMLHKR